VNGDDESQTAAANAASRQYDWRPRPDPTVLTTAALRETEAALLGRFRDGDASLRELLEERLRGMDTATKLLAERVDRIPVDADAAREHLRQDIAAQVLALRELVTGRIDGIDRATKLLAENVDKLPSDIDRSSAALREVVEGLITNVRDVTLEKFDAVNTRFLERDTRTEQAAQESRISLDAALAAAKEAVSEQNKANAQAIQKSEIATQKQIDANAANTATSIKAIAERLDDVKARLDKGEGGIAGSADQRTETRLDRGSMTGSVQAIIMGIAIMVSLISVIAFVLKK
jgi:hypothetical protein